MSRVLKLTMKLWKYFQQTEKIGQKCGYACAGRKFACFNPVMFLFTCIQMAEKMNVKTIIDTDGEVLKLSIQSKPYAIKPVCMNWSR